MKCLFRRIVSISRTRTKIKITENTTGNELGGQKRQRSETSPEIFNRNKIPKELNIQGDPKNNQNHEVKQGVNDSEGKVQIIIESLDIIQNIMLRKADGDTNVLSEEDQSKVNTALLNAYKHFTEIAYKIGQLEKENLQLNYLYDITSKKKLEPLNITTPGSHLHAGRTYSSATSQRTPSHNNKTWEIPPQTRKVETVIRIKDQKDPKQVIKEIKKNVSKSDTEGNFKKVTQLKSGAVLIECQSEAQQQKLNQNLANKNFDVKDITAKDPMFLITGIIKGFTAEAFINELIAENPELIQTFGENIRTQLKVISKKDCKNKQKENWILQACPKIFKWFMENKFLTFDLATVYTQEYVNVSICFKCSNFGHVAKYCQRSECCHKCGGGHNAKDCTKDTLECPNCTKMGLLDRSHSARNISCPIYQKRVDRIRQNTNYSDGNDFL